MPLNPATASLIGAGITSATDLIGGLFGRKGQKQANRQNIQFAREQMAFQERMSNTAYQRAAKDLEMAGLNRILALGKPASTPSGQTATMQNPNAALAANLKGTGAAAIHSAHQMAAIENIRANTRKTNAQTDAIAPAAEAGEQIGDWIGSVKKTHWESIKDRVKTDIKGLRPGGQTYTALTNKIDNIARSMGLRGDVMQRQLIEVVDQMDAPPNMTNEQKLIWAAQNLDKIARFVDRQKRNRGQ
ncbi:DNA pilot protein [Microviridae sp.]|nr:DNA pilot protein [Microviridae sp.]